MKNIKLKFGFDSDIDALDSMIDFIDSSRDQNNIFASNIQNGFLTGDKDMTIEIVNDAKNLYKLTIKKSDIEFNNYTLYSKLLIDENIDITNLLLDMSTTFSFINNISDNVKIMVDKRWNY